MRLAVGDVGVEGRLDRLRLGLAHERPPGVSSSKPGAAVQPGAGARAEGLPAAPPRRGRAARPGCGSRAARSRSTVFGPMPGIRPGDSAAKRSSASLAAEHDEPGGLAQLAGDLRQQLALGDPDRAAQPGLLADLGGDPPHRRLRGEEPGEVDVGLVEADHLDRLDVARAGSPSPRRDARGRRRSRAAGRPRPGAAAGRSPPASPSGSRPACAPRSWRS